MTPPFPENLLFPVDWGCYRNLQVVKMQSRIDHGVLKPNDTFITQPFHLRLKELYGRRGREIIRARGSGHFLWDNIFCIWKRSCTHEIFNNSDNKRTCMMTAQVDVLLWTINRCWERSILLHLPPLRYPITNNHPQAHTYMRNTKWTQKDVFTYTCVYVCTHI